MANPIAKLPRREIIEQAQEALREFSRVDGSPNFTVRVEPIEGRSAVSALVPREAFEMFLTVLRHLAQGEAVSILPQQAELTTQQAADLLNVSRPFLIKLLERGDIPHHKVGRHRRIRAVDLLAHASRQRDDSEEALQELADLSQELGLI